MNAFMGLLTCGFCLWLPLTRSGNGSRLQSQPSSTLFTALEIAVFSPGSPSIATAPKLPFGNPFESMFILKRQIAEVDAYFRSLLALTNCVAKGAEAVYMCSPHEPYVRLHANLIGYLWRSLLPSVLGVHKETIWQAVIGPNARRLANQRARTHGVMALS